MTRVFLLLPPFYQNVCIGVSINKQLKWKCQGDEYVVNILHSCKSHFHGLFRDIALAFLNLFNRQKAEF